MNTLHSAWSGSGSKDHKKRWHPIDTFFGFTRTKLGPCLEELSPKCCVERIKSYLFHQRGSLLFTFWRCSNRFPLRCKTDYIGLSIRVWLGLGKSRITRVVRAVLIAQGMKFEQVAWCFSLCFWCFHLQVQLWLWASSCFPPIHGLHLIILWIKTVVPYSTCRLH